MKYKGSSILWYICYYTSICYIKLVYFPSLYMNSNSGILKELQHIILLKIWRKYKEEWPYRLWNILYIIDIES